jgi:hypothetical protein
MAVGAIATSSVRQAPAEGLRPLASTLDNPDHDGVGWELRALLAPPRAGLRGTYARARTARLSAAQA